jgi:ribosome biogenesis GTPase / thiamine phosphate phosphatase
MAFQILAVSRLEDAPGSRRANVRMLLMFSGGLPLTELLDGLVIKEQSGFFWVTVEDGTTYTCRLRGRLMEEAQSSDIAAIGDRVKISVLEDGSGMVESVAERVSALSRAARTEGNRGAGQAEREHVIIANADQALFVFAAAQPSPSLKMLDRFLVAGEKSEIEKLVIVINKIDLLKDREQIETSFLPYAEMGYQVLYTSALQREGIEPLRDLLADKISVFTGPSGVGKTSLLNAVQPGLGRVVKEVSQRRKEGLHTTRDSELVKLDVGGYLADTPGMRSLTVWDVEPDELDAYFIDVAPYVSRCRFGDCTHHNEPKCAVRQAVDEGKISKARYQSYLQLRDELEEAFVVY